ncbi:MAG TPA: response regulator transcription factor [Candidatus Angelobacter sp.]|jgi:DNA-binding NarL/FixJ family response regulator
MGTLKNRNVVFHNVGLHSEATAHQLAPLERSLEELPACYICSDHPLALASIREAISSDARLRTRVRSYYQGDSRPLPGVKNQVLVLDTLSVGNWRACLDKWSLEGGFTIALISSQPGNRELELQLLLLGASGVLTFADLSLQLTDAVYAAAAGRLWFKREVLHSYVKQTRTELRRGSSCHKFTAREKQITSLLLQDLSNRAIAQRLAISERTIKFHVSNILRKVNVGSRKELCELPDSFNDSRGLMASESGTQAFAPADLHHRPVNPPKLLSYCHKESTEVVERRTVDSAIGVAATPAAKR